MIIWDTKSFTPVQELTSDQKESVTGIIRKSGHVWTVSEKMVGLWKYLKPDKPLQKSPKKHENQLSQTTPINQFIGRKNSVFKPNDPINTAPFAAGTRKPARASFLGGARANFMSPSTPPNSSL